MLAFHDPGPGAVDPFQDPVAPLEAGARFVAILDFMGFHGPCVQFIRFDGKLRPRGQGGGRLGPRMTCPR